MSYDTTANMSTTTSPFLYKLPLELRKMVYQDYFKSSTVNITYISRKFERLPKAACVNLLLVCKQIHEEAVEEYAKHTEFHALLKESPWPSLLASKNISNLTIVDSNESYLDTYNQMLAIRNQYYNYLKMSSLTIVSSAHRGIEFPLMMELSPVSLLGENVNKLTQIIEFKSRLFFARKDIPLLAILKAINLEKTPLSPIYIAVITTVQKAAADTTTKLEIFGPGERDVKLIYETLMKRTGGEIWLGAPKEIVVYFTESWPYRTLKAESKVDINTGERRLTWEGADDEERW